MIYIKVCFKGLKMLHNGSVQTEYSRRNMGCFLTGRKWIVEMAEYCLEHNGLELETRTNKTWNLTKSLKTYTELETELNLAELENKLGPRNYRN